MERITNISFVGLGNMGKPMAGHLARAGYTLSVYDTDPKAMEDFVAEHACQSASGAAQAAEGCQLAITMLPNGDLVRRVVLGEGDQMGMCETMPQGSVLVDMSSSAPVGTRELGEELVARGISMIDAPVSGGVKRALDGSLSILVGGEPSTVQYCRPVLETMGGTVFETRPLGSAHALKALNNMLSAMGLLSTAEVLMIGKRFGLDLNTMVDVFNASTGQNNSTKNKIKQFVLSRSFNSGFSLELMVKDLGLAVGLAKATSTPTILSGTCREMWASALSSLQGRPDHTEIVRWLEQTLHTELAP